MEEINFEDFNDDYDVHKIEHMMDPSEIIEKPIVNEKFGSNRKVFTPPECIKTVYCDGGSKIVKVSGDKPVYIGAWAFYIEEDKVTVSELQIGATNNQMEIKAVIEAIKALNTMGVPKDKWCTFLLDSKYVQMGIIFWSKKWAKNGWKRVLADGTEEEVKNLDLWKELYELNAERKIFYKHVPSHSGIEGNEKVDIACANLIKDYYNKHFGKKN